MDSLAVPVEQRIRPSDPGRHDFPIGLDENGRKFPVPPTWADRVLGCVLLITGVVMIFNLDTKFESKLGEDSSLPAFLVDPTRALENSGSVQNKLASLRPTSRFEKREKTAPKVADITPISAHVAIAGVMTPALQNLGWGHRIDGDFGPLQPWL